MAQPKTIASDQDKKLFQQLIENIQMLNIHLFEHNFKREEGSVKPHTNSANIDSHKGTFHTSDDRLIVRKITIIKAKEVSKEAKDTGKEIFHAKYDYELCFSFIDKNVVEQCLANEYVKNMFLNNNLSKFIWPYLRNEIQSDTLKAGLPPLVLPLLK